MDTVVKVTKSAPAAMTRIIVVCDRAFAQEARLAAALSRQTISRFGRESIKAAIERTRREAAAGRLEAR